MLTERNDHLDRLERELVQSVGHLVVLRAGMGKKQRQAISQRLEAIPRDEARVILATGKYVGEGFDDPRLDTLFLTLPVSWRGTIAQYAGRLHRLYDSKREVRIYDYADLNVPMLATTSFFAFWQKTSARNSTRCSMLSCVHSAVGRPRLRLQVP